jgi:hypothetical protein
MVQRLTHVISWLLLSVSLASCAANTGSTTPSSVSEFCSLTAADLPIRLSRKDTPVTQRDVAKLNAKHKERCKQ